jgi:hypothetical protein
MTELSLRPNLHLTAWSRRGERQARLNEFERAVFPLRYEVTENRRLASPPLRLPKHIRLSPRLDRLQRTSALSAPQSSRKLIEREPHRDFWEANSSDVSASRGIAGRSTPPGQHVRINVGLVFGLVAAVQMPRNSRNWKGSNSHQDGSRPESSGHHSFHPTAKGPISPAVGNRNK